LSYRHDLVFKPWTLDFTPVMPGGEPDIPQAFLDKGRGLAQRLLALKFEDEDWDAPLRAIDAVVEFAEKADEWRNWHRGDPPTCRWQERNERGELTVVTLEKLRGLWTDKPEFVEGELQQLRQLMSDERDRYMPEIIAQIDGSPNFYLGLLGFTGDQKPWTRALINFALRVAEFVALHYKKVYKRARASTLCPGLLPEFGPPAHPAFPSGHSSLAAAFFAAGALLLSRGRTRRATAALGAAAVAIAAAVATSRVFLDVHWVSDVVAGVGLGWAWFALCALAFGATFRTGWRPA